ncbi:hypothetical protein AU074_13890 [Pseudomonas sp. ATCC PTA-122608]|uniref:hypothetical protein n=1 Tax=Pseudomonas sp. ATCC PTA-122608 TaxID=1771311 RepID=UPI00096BCB2A|nr:hypothetical protein [Pseudomonas sp. ATCC PTA-122608]OLY72262.1 hypothetical protein AU074_13890 [Pseudomonas sp. ATCC PTA-122608]
MLQVQLRFEGQQEIINKFVADNFPEWDDESDINDYGGELSDFFDELGLIYHIDNYNEKSFGICFVNHGIDDEWSQDIFEYLTALGMNEICIDYADEDGEYAGYQDFSTGVREGEEFHGGDLNEVSEYLLGVIESWDSMHHLFENEE